jgi:hypothetical protein
MTPDAHSVAAALTAPWCAWHPEAPDEATLIDILDRFGPLPQADLFEPWHPTDPWSARVLRPPLEQAAALLRHGSLIPSDPPGLLEWLDRGRILEETSEHGSFTFLARADAEDGGFLTPALQDGPPADLQTPLREHTAPAATARYVVHPTTGRPGLHLDVPVPDQDPVAERDVVTTAIAAVLGTHAPPVDPTLTTWYTFQHIHVVAWLVAPSRRTLPIVPWDLPAISLSGWTGARELQVSSEASAHEETTLAIAGRIGPAGWIGDRPRWIGDRFVATWRHADAATPPEVTARTRLVPGCPPGLEPDWLGVDPEVWGAGDRFVMRLTCSLRDRDLLPVLRPRDADAIDRELAERLGSLARIDPVHAGFDAVRLRLADVPAAAWPAIVAAVGHLPVASIGPVAFVRMVPRVTLLLVRTDRDAEIPTWSAA